MWARHLDLVGIEMNYMKFVNRRRETLLRTHNRPDADGTFPVAIINSCDRATFLTERW